MNLQQCLQKSRTCYKADKTTFFMQDVEHCGCKTHATLQENVYNVGVLNFCMALSANTRLKHTVRLTCSCNGGLRCIRIAMVALSVCCRHHFNINLKHCIILHHSKSLLNLQKK